MRGFFRALPQKQVGTKGLAVLCCGIVVLSLLPVLGISFFNHPYYDDFASGGQLTQRILREGGSFWTLLGAAFEGAWQSYINWEGNYVTNYVNAIQISAVSQELCYVATLVLLLSVVLSWVYFCKTVLGEVLHAPASVWLISACMMIFLSVHLIPYANEAFFWQSGGIKYTLGNSFFVWLVALAAKIRFCTARSQRVGQWRCAGLALSAFLCAGSNLMTGIGAVAALGLATMYVWLVARNGPGKRSLLIALAVGLAGFAANVLAPGNAVRQGDAANMSPVLAIINALYATVEYIGRWTNLPWMAVSCLVALLLLPYIRNSSLRFGHPVLMLFASFSVLAAQLAPPVYTNIYYDSGRIANTMYLAYSLFLLVNVIYGTGWLVNRTANSHPAAQQGAAQGSYPLPLPAVAAIALALAVGCAGYGLTKMTGGAAAKALATGQAARYDQAYRERTALLEQPGGAPVWIVPMEDVPMVFMDENYSWRSMLICLSAYYEKEVADGRQLQ